MLKSQYARYYHEWRGPMPSEDNDIFLKRDQIEQTML